MTTPNKSYRLSTGTQRKLRIISAATQRSDAQTLTHLVEKAYEEMEMDIELIEDNAGGLYVGNEAVGYWVAGETGTLFIGDAACIVSGETADWTLEHVFEAPKIAGWNEDGARLVAIYRAGVALMQRNPGHAAAKYLG